MNEYAIYREKALEASRHVFVVEYNRSIGIPLPKIEFMLPDSDNYQSGEYYIRIGDSWQIHLNFGLLPASYKDFQEEVRVLTRHEVEHYICCPFDVITHFRMLGAIINTYRESYSNNVVDILSLSSSIANQVADIIVDTKNFRRKREETLKSERSWIRKASNVPFSKSPRYSRLMFLTKEALWNEDLGLENSDNELKAEVAALAEVFEYGGIENKSLFISKVIQYTHTFFKLFKRDQEDQGQQEQSETNTSSANNNSSHALQFLPQKDTQAHGSHLIFQSPERVAHALDQLAQESSVEQFNQILSAAGISKLHPVEIQKIWFEAQNTDIIPIIEQGRTGSPNNYSYPTSWRISDPVEELDMMLSFSNSPIIIPGITTKRWVQNSQFSAGREENILDLLLIMDMSGSMGSITDPKASLHQAVLAKYGIMKYFESKDSLVALIGFSENISTKVEWTNEYDRVREALLRNGNGGTNFPIREVQDIIEGSRNQIVTVIITDGEIQNTGNTINYFKEYLVSNNKLYIFLQERTTMIDNYRVLIDHGAKVLKALTAKEMRDRVLNDLK